MPPAGEFSAADLELAKTLVGDEEILALYRTTPEGAIDVVKWMCSAALVPCVALVAFTYCIPCTLGGSYALKNTMEGTLHVLTKTKLYRNIDAKPVGCPDGVSIRPMACSKGFSQTNNGSVEWEKVEEMTSQFPAMGMCPFMTNFAPPAIILKTPASPLSNLGGTKHSTAQHMMVVVKDKEAALAVFQAAKQGTLESSAGQPEVKEAEVMIRT